MGPSEGRGAVKSTSHPFSSFHRTIRFRSLQMRSSISLTFKNTPSFPLGTYVMLSPRPLSLLSSVPTAAASCSSTSIHSGSRMSIFLSHRHTQSSSLDLVGWLEQSWLIHHHREGRERLSYHKHSATPLTLSATLPFPCSVPLMHTWAWQEGHGARTLFSAMESYCHFQSIRKTLPHHPHCYA